MAIKTYEVLFDCKQPTRLAQFWAAALGFEVQDWSNDQDGAGIFDPTGQHQELAFYPVPEDKTVKNRLHLDLVPTTTMEEEVARLEGLGATRYADFKNWIVLQDPEGNEFCVLRGENEPR